MKNLPLQTGGAVRVSSRNHHLRLQTQTREEAQGQDTGLHTGLGRACPECMELPDIPTKPHGCSASSLQADQDPEDQAVTKEVSHPQLKNRNPLSYTTSTSSPYPF